MKNMKRTAVRGAEPEVREEGACPDSRISKQGATKHRLKRHHVARLKAARRFYWGGQDLTLDPVLLAKVVQTPHTCSCLACGNDRKWLGERTIQERRFMQNQHDDGA